MKKERKLTQQHNGELVMKKERKLTQLKFLYELKNRLYDDLVDKKDPLHLAAAAPINSELTEMIVKLVKEVAEINNDTTD